MYTSTSGLPISSLSMPQHNGLFTYIFYRWLNQTIGIVIDIENILRIHPSSEKGE